MGALMVYSSRVDAFDPDEQELMLRLAEDLSFGLGALRDRQERERAEARLHEREALYRQLVQKFPNGALGLFDRDLRYVLVAGEGLAIIGQSSASMEGRSNREIFPRELADSMDAHYRAALEGTSSHLELPMAGRWFDVHVRPVHGADGRVTAGFVSSVDVTERKLREVLDPPGGRGTGSPAPA
jgi:PAS domain S-box-containing protein